MFGLEDSTLQLAFVALVCRTGFIAGMIFQVLAKVRFPMWAFLRCKLVEPMNNFVWMVYGWFIGDIHHHPSTMTSRWPLRQRPCREDVWDALTMMDAQPDGRIVLLYSGYVIPPGARDHEFSAGWNRDSEWPGLVPPICAIWVEVLSDFKADEIWQEYIVKGSGISFLGIGTGRI